MTNLSFDTMADLLAYLNDNNLVLDTVDLSHPDSSGYDLLLVLKKEAKNLWFNKALLTEDLFCQYDVTYK